MSQGRRQLRFPSTLEGIHFAEKLVDDVCNEYSVKEDFYGEILICLTEAVNNAVVHGNKLQEGTEVSLTFELANEKTLQFTIDGNVEMQGDRAMLRRAFGNLLANAIRYGHAGTTIAVRLQSGGDVVAVSIENHGDTIDPQQLPKLFDRFYRADTSRHRSSEGAGLGLAITQSIIRAHHGTIAVESAEGRTTFRIRFPSRAAPANPPAL